MRKYIKLLVFVLLIYTTSSCDDFLKPKSNSTFTEGSIFTNLDFATKEVNGIYYNLTSDYLYGYQLGLYYKCDNDIECLFGADDGGKRSAGHYVADAGNSSIKNTWNILYATIERANICIDGLPKSPVWTGDYAKDAHRLYGEAITLRALCYSELIGLWGDVPFKVKATQAGDNFNLPKTDRDSIYEYLIKDLKDVQDDVPWMTESPTTVRVTKGFVKGLRARMALAYAGYSLRNKTFETRRGRYWQDYYKIANQECREIMESAKHQLNPGFINIFKTIQAYTMDLTYKEVLFEIAFGRLYTGNVAYVFGMAFSSSPSDPKYGKSGGEFSTTPYYYYSFDRSDTRRNVSVEMYDYSNASHLSQQWLISDNGQRFKPSKWRRSWIVPSLGGALKDVTYTGVHWPIMRYADVVLMFAETENEINGGPTQAAKDAISLIRERAFPSNLWPLKVVHYVDSVSVSKTDFFNALVDERAWEFGGELIRKYDLVRWNLLGTKIKQMRDECQKIINDDPKYANVPTYVFWKTTSDGETINILNPDYRLPSTAIAGYTRNSWLSLMSADRKANFTNTMNLVAHGYDAAKNNHLYPIHSDIITASNGILSNDQIP